MRKLRKLLKQPGPFFRDFFINKFPVINNELGCTEKEESILVNYSIKFEKDYLSISNDVDVVYTWVNKDEKWEIDFEKYRLNVNREKLGMHAADPARFENHEELFFSIKSVRKYLPWVRKIYVITNSLDCLPDYLTKDPIIEIVHHKELIPEKFLPTFNSHVIEAFLHKLSGLSENFIYFNDDVFVARELSKEHFFQSNGLASLFVSNKTFNFNSKKKTPTLHAYIRGKKLLKEIYDVNINYSLVHTYVPLKKSMYQLAWDLYSEQILLFLDNRFRGNNDLNMATFLVPWLSYISGLSSINSDICYYFNFRSPHAVSQYKNLLSKNRKDLPHSVCINDFVATRDDMRYRELLVSFLNSF